MALDSIWIQDQNVEKGRMHISAYGWNHGNPFMKYSTKVSKGVISIIYTSYGRRNVFNCMVVFLQWYIQISFMALWYHVMYAANYSCMCTTVAHRVFLSKSLTVARCHLEIWKTYVWTLDQNTNIFVQGNIFEVMSSKTAAVVCGPWRVKCILFWNINCGVSNTYPLPWFFL